MTAYNNNWLKRNSGVPSLTPFVTVHEDASQTIQGGVAGEHYHLTAAQLDLVNTISVLTTSLNNANAILAKPIYEPVMAGGELAVTVAGDLLMARGDIYAS